MSRLFALGSIILHAVVITAVFVAQLMADGPLPTPRRALLFDNARLVTIADIELPNPPHARAIEPPRTVAYDAAPIAPPEGITRETGLEGRLTPPAPVDSMLGLDGGPGAADGLGTVEKVAPPPSPPAAPAQRAPVRLHAGIEPPAKTTDVAPVYPPLARMSHVSGMVILEAIIDAQGGVQSVRVLKSIPVLDQAAIDAVRQWRFTPARLDGHAIPVVMTVTVNFQLDR